MHSRIPNWSFIGQSQDGRMWWQPTRSPKRDCQISLQAGAGAATVPGFEMGGEFDTVFDVVKERIRDNAHLSLKAEVQSQANKE